MNPTQKQDNSGPESRPFGDNFVGLFTDKDRFRAWVASATDTAAESVPGPATTPVLGLPMTDVDRRRYALREAGYTGWVDNDGRARTEAEVEAWSALMRGLQVGYLRGVGGGWVLTEVGRRSFEQLSTSEQFDIAKALLKGVDPCELVDADWDGQPLVEWLSDRDADEADSYDERPAERCQAQAEAVDAADIGYDLTDAGRAALGVPVSDEEPVAWVAVRGWCEVCSQALPWNCTWTEPLCSACVLIAGTGSKPNAEYVSTCPVDLVTETDDETTARVLRSAATYLQRHGWIQGAYYDATSGSFTPAACMVGAIGMVCYGGPVDAPAQHFDNPGFLNFEAAVLHLDRFLLVEDSSESYEFNDAKGRTVDQVVDVLRKAAARPAHELIDALKAIDAQNANAAALVELLIPSGVFADRDNDGDRLGGDLR
jgi:hypothetical protein